MQDLLLESVKYMILGMSIVYLLLLCIVFLTKLQSKIITKYFVNKKESLKDTKKDLKSQNSVEDKAVVAVITAAITAYKKGR